MTENLEMNINLKKLERKTSLLYFQDGLWDMNLGLTLIVFGIGELAYDYISSPFNSLLSPILFAVIFTSFVIAKRNFTQSRIGVIVPTHKKQEKMKTLTIILLFCVIMTIIIIVLTVTDKINLSEMGIYLAIFFGLLPLFIFGLMATFLNYNRLYINGVIFGLALFINEILHITGDIEYSGISLICAGIIIVIMGCFYLKKFCEKYPSMQGEQIGN